MNLTLDPKIEREFSEIATRSGVSPEAALAEAVEDWMARHQTNGANGSHAPSKLSAAVEKIKANPIRTLGPVDAVADIEFNRAARDNRLGDVP